MLVSLRTNSKGIIEVIGMLSFAILREIFQGLSLERPFDDNKRSGLARPFDDNKIGAWGLLMEYIFYGRFMLARED
jgi:hypothetical protein